MENNVNSLDEGMISMQEENLEPATAGIRFANYLLDVVFYYIILFILSIGVALVAGPAFAENTVLLYIYIFGIMFAYYVAFEFLMGKTIGKMITGTRVVMETGEKPTLGAVVARTLCRFIPFEAFSFLGNGVGWHDTISKTRVVKKSAR